MSVNQKAFVKCWLLVLALTITLSIFHEKVWFCVIAFMIVTTYATSLAKEISSVRMKSAMDTLQESNRLMAWFVLCILFEVGLSLYFVLSGRDLRDYIGNVGLIMIALLAPVLPAVVISQRNLYRKLGEKP